MARARAASPQERPENDGEQDLKWTVLRMHVRGNRSAEIPGQQRCPKNRRARDGIQDRAGEQDDPERENYAFGVTQLNRGLHDEWGLDELHGAVHEEKEHRQCAEDPSGPERGFRHGSVG